ncbi:MAG TPA: adenylate/guanylate cyclase domain-containing protein [Nitrospiria bacterium]|jgi:adenylate cyclase
MKSRRGKKIRWLALALSVLITLFFLYIDLMNPSFARNTLDLLESKTLDFRFLLRNARNPGKPNPDLLIIAIDEKSLKEVGRWPWSRGLMAQLLEKLAKGKPRVIGADILFIEPEVSESIEVIRTLKQDLSIQPSSNSGILKSLQKLEETADKDTLLAQVIGTVGIVILPTGMEVHTEYMLDKTIKPPDAPVSLVNSSFGLVKKLSAEKVFYPIEAQVVSPPLPALTRRAQALGHVYYQPDRDGVLRWEYLVLKYRDDFYPSFALQIARAALGLKREEMKLWLGEAVEMGNIKIPTDERGRMLVNYIGREGTFPLISATDVLHDRIPSDFFGDKIILIGTTAVGTYDLKVSPLSANMPGVEKNATVVNNILNHQFLQRTQTMKFLDAFFILAFGAILFFSLPRLGALRGVALAGVLLIGYLFLAQYLFEKKGLWINLLYPSSTIVFSYTFLTVLRFMTEEKHAQEIRRIFSNYVSPKMVAELVKDPDKAKLGGERKKLTVLFSDVRGFTAFSEKHQPEEVVATLNEYMNAMTEVIFRWDGTLDKFIGDAIMVFWGAPLDQHNHAELAIRCALHMQKRLGELHQKWEAEGKDSLDAGIGIHTGEMVVGNMGAEGRKMDYTVIGDNVNLGARVESLTKEYQANILITEATYQEAQELIEIKDLFPKERRRSTSEISHREKRKKRMKIGHAQFKDHEPVKVKGKDKPVRVFEVIGLQEEKK